MLATTAAGLCLGAAACSGSSSPASTGSAASAPPRCSVPHAARIAYDRYGALFRSRATGGDRVYRACPAGGKPILIGHSQCRPLRGNPAVGALRLAGPYVAYASVRCGVDTAQSTVTVLDMRRRRNVVSSPAVGPPGVPEGVQSVLALRVRFDGATAWIGAQRSLAGGHETRELWVADSAHHTHMLDSGGGLDPTSLRLDRTRVSWRNNSASHSASLR